MAEVPWILSSPLATQIILPFVLVFVLLFAILDRTKILGEEKRTINAIISLVIALIFVTFSRAVEMVSKLMPFLAVLAVVILVFMVLWGFIAGGFKSELIVNTGIKITGGVIITLALVIAVIYITGFSDVISSWFQGGSSGAIASTIVFLVVIGGAIALVLATGNKSS